MDSLLTASLIARTLALLALSLCAFPTAHGVLHITEFMADNGGSRLDSDGDFNAEVGNLAEPAIVETCAKAAERERGVPFQS